MINKVTTIINYICVQELISKLYKKIMKIQDYYQKSNKVEGLQELMKNFT